MPGRDVGEILDRTDLAALADELCGPRRGRGTGARWPSPVHGHPQTGKSPPMSIFTDRRGRQRWTCWATGASGTAIDLVMTARGFTLGDAIRWLGDRAGQQPAVRPPAHPPQPPEPASPSEGLREYVEACSRLLRGSAGARARSWLRNRQLDPTITDLNKLGFDPGRRRLRRARGLPLRAPGIVIPSFDLSGDLVYAQTRYLDPAAAGRKYDNPTSSHASKPRLSWPRGTREGDGPVIVCEGVIDALTAAGAGLSSVALLAAGDAHSVAADLAGLARNIVIVTDGDDAGHRARTTLAVQLAEAGCSGVRHIVLPSDINDFARSHRSSFPRTFRAVVAGSRASVRRVAIGRP